MYTYLYFRRLRVKLVIDLFRKYSNSTSKSTQASPQKWLKTAVFTSRFRLFWSEATISRIIFYFLFSLSFFYKHREKYCRSRRDKNWFGKISNFRTGLLHLLCSINFNDSVRNEDYELSKYALFKLVFREFLHGKSRLQVIFQVFLNL